MCGYNDDSPLTNPDIVPLVFHRESADQYVDVFDFLRHIATKCRSDRHVSAMCLQNEISSTC